MGTKTETVILGHRSMSAVIGCLVIMAVKPTGGWRVTAVKTISKQYVQMQEKSILRQYRQNWMLLCCYGLYCFVAPLLWRHFHQGPKTWWVSVGPWSFGPVSILLSMVICAFFLDSDWLRIWPRHIPAPQTGPPRTCLPPRPWWERCLTHCSAGAGAHLREREELISVSSFLEIYCLQGHCKANGAELTTG